MRIAGTKIIHKTIGMFSAVLTFMLLPCLAFAGAPVQSVTIEEAFALVLKIDERIKIAEADITKSRILSKKASTYFWPRIAVRGGYFEADEKVENGPYIATSETPGVGPFEITHIDNNVITPRREWRGRFEFLQPLYRGVYFPLKRQAEQIIKKFWKKICQAVGL